jgi:TRAP-type C4-dicarboxylate transport system permease small subunit
MDVQVNAPRPRALLIWLAGGALLLAMVVDTLAMVGRQLHLPLIGSIEIVQAAVLFASAGGLIIAAFDQTHARVQLVLDRLPRSWRGRAERLHALAAALVYTALLVGSVWIAADLWRGHEESELLRIPYRPLRVAVVLALAVLAAQALRRAFRREPR